MKTNAKAKILQLLKDAGTRGSTTWELITSTHCSAAARRVWDLQQEGHRIEKRDEGGGVYRWIYRGAPEPKLHQMTFSELRTLIAVERNA